MSVLFEAENVIAWLYQPAESGARPAVTSTTGSTVSFVYVLVVGADSSSYGAWLVALAANVSGPSSSELRSMPLKLTVAAPSDGGPALALTSGGLP